MYNYNNKDKSKEEGINDWYELFSKDNTNTHTIDTPFNFTHKLNSLYREIMKRYPSVREGNKQ